MIKKKDEDECSVHPDLEELKVVSRERGKQRGRESS